MNNPRFNVIILIIFLVIGSLFLSVFNLVVDPFGIYKIMTVKGLNERKPEIKKHITLVKTLSVNKIKPKSVILGSSRAAFGFDPEYNVWSQKPVYNMAFPGIDISATYQYFKDALNQKSVKTVVLAVDFFMFNRYLNNKNGIDNAILNINESINKRLKYYVRLVSINFSIDTLMSSVSTLMNQSGDEDAYKPNGQMSRKYLEKILEEAGGHRESFIISERNFLTVMWFPEPGYGFQFADKTGNSFDSFVSILELAYNENIDLKILISPSHARHWESLEAVGLWPLFEKWKEKMVILNENKARELNKTPFDLWDFSGYNEYTTEEVPEKNDRSKKMKWYYESSHFKPELGNLVLDRVLGRRIKTTMKENVFGVKLTTKNIMEHLAHIRFKQSQYKSEHEQYLKEIEWIINKSVVARLMRKKLTELHDKQ